MDIPDQKQIDALQALMAPVKGLVDALSVVAQNIHCCVDPSFWKMESYALQYEGLGIQRDEFDRFAAFAKDLASRTTDEAWSVLQYGLRRLAYGLALWPDGDIDRWADEIVAAKYFMNPTVKDLAEVAESFDAQMYRLATRESLAWRDLRTVKHGIWQKARDRVRHR